jgi:hypothetical protein
MATQPAISSIDRLHPAHKPVAASITQTLTQGDCMRLSVSAAPRDLGLPTAGEM